MVRPRALRVAATAAAFGVWLVACDSDVTPGAPPEGRLPAGGAEVPAPPFDAGPVRTATEYLLEPEFAEADAARGELLGLACAACHKFRADEGTLIGPNLHGVFGRPAAAVPGFNYSPALEGSGLIWTPKSLEAWLEDPAGFIEGTTMAFAGYRSAEDRRALIAYLLRATQ